MKELEPLADWFVRAISDYGQGSVRATAQVAGLDERSLYTLVNAERLLPMARVRAMAAGLEQDLVEAEKLWAEAKQRLEQAESRRRRERQPKLSGWADIRDPEPALRDLLEAQRRLLDCLPYRQLGLVEPLMSTVFVRQSVRHLSGPDLDAPIADDPTGQLADPRHEDRTVAAAPSVPREKGYPEEETPVGLADALNRHEHLVVIGDPGSGKSTLANQLGLSLAQLWLRESAVHEAPVAEAVVPLRLPATLLAGEEGPWSESVRNTVRRCLGRGLVSEPAAALFSGRIAGARWLLFVDGLDEIADVNQRADLIRTLAGHTRPGGDFRFVITTRPLPNIELAPLQSSTVGCYEMQPFEETQLAEYALRWFQQQPSDAPDPQRSSKRFLDDVQDGALKELVKSPLLATIALVQATLRPAQPLPTSLVALYRSFFEILRRNRPNAPGWAVDILDDLLTALAQRQVDGADDLLGDIEPMVRSLVGGSRPLPADWRPIITSTVNQSGIVVIVGDRIRFIHHSFAEFLVARQQAEAMGADEQELGRWIERAGTSARSTLARFTLWHWADGPSGSAEQLIAKVLSMPGAQPGLLAGSLIAEGLNPKPEQVAEASLRLCGLVRLADNGTAASEAANLLAALAWRHPTAHQLEELVRNPALPATARYAALKALSRICPVELTGALLELLLEYLYSLLPEAATLSLTLAPSTRMRVRERLDQLVNEIDADSWEWSLGAEGYRVLGDVTEAARFSRRALTFTGSRIDDMRRAVKTWLASGDAAEHVALLAEIARNHDARHHAGRMLFAQELADAGATDAASELLLALLTCDDARDQHGVAAELWLRLQGPAAAAPVVELVERLEALGVEIWRMARLVRLLCDVGVEFPGLEWCRTVLPPVGRWPIGAVDVLETWAALGGQDCWDELAAVVGDGRRLNMFDVRATAKLFLDGGRHEEARRLALLALLTPTGDGTGAAEILLRIDREKSIAEWTARARAADGSSSWAYAILEAPEEITPPDVKDLSRALAELILGAPDATPVHVELAVYVCLALDDREHLPRLVEVTCHHPGLTIDKRRDMAMNLAAWGQIDAARTIWRYLLSIRGRDTESLGAALVGDILQMDSPQTAVDLLQELLAADPPQPPSQNGRLQRLLTWTASGPSRF